MKNMITANFTGNGRLKPLLVLGGDEEITIKLECTLGSSIWSCEGLKFSYGVSIPAEFHQNMKKIKKNKSTRSICWSISSSRMNVNASSPLSKFNNVEDDNAGAGAGWSCEKDGMFDDIIDEDPEFEKDELSCFRALVLDIFYRPVHVVCWKRAICLEYTEKADVLEYYDQTVSSPGGSFYIPAVLRIPHLLQVVKRRRVRRNLSRKNIYFRDNFTCQYCSSGENLTVDHILPVTRGGEWSWENLVTACAKCNSRKGQKTPEEANMKLLKIPKQLSKNFVRKYLKRFVF